MHNVKGSSSRESAKERWRKLNKCSPRSTTLPKSRQLYKIGTTRTQHDEWKQKNTTLRPLLMCHNRETDAPRFFIQICYAGFHPNSAKVSERGILSNAFDISSRVVVVYSCPGYVTGLWKDYLLKPFRYTLQSQWGRSLQDKSFNLGQRSLTKWPFQNKRTSSRQ